uniref:SXP/RAL-2 family protein Ani s 5-like cation-binding domain-containing protein n=1 Tax=Strongyloides stercoralis TaxID=6248 RepID=A0A0K0E9Q7_STRER
MHSIKYLAFLLLLAIQFTLQDVPSFQESTKVNKVEEAVTPSKTTVAVPSENGKPLMQRLKDKVKNIEDKVKAQIHQIKVKTEDAMKNSKNKLSSMKDKAKESLSALKSKLPSIKLPGKSNNNKNNENNSNKPSFTDKIKGFGSGIKNKFSIFL